MTALHMDGFDHYGTGGASVTNMLAGPWAVVSGQLSCTTPSWGAAATGAYCLGWTGVNPSIARRVLPTPGAHFFLSFRFALNQLVTGAAFPVVFMDGSANGLFSLNITSTGVIQLLQGTPSQLSPPSTYVVIAQTAGPVVVSENWHFFEMEINTSANTFTLRVDDAQGTGTPILTVTDARITGTIAQMGYIVFNLGQGGGNATPTFIDDLFVRDPNGTVNNGWLGDRRIATLLGNADTTTAGWTPRFYHEFGAGILDLHTSLGSFLTASASSSLDLGSADFTLEGFFRLGALPAASGYHTFFSRWDSANNHRSWRFIYGGSSFNNSSLQFDISTDGSNSTASTMIQFPWAPDVDRWYHIVLVRASGELLLFVDGNQLGLPIADSHAYYSGGAEVLGIGAEVQGTSTPVAFSGFYGWADETRITVGYARYTTSFAVPTSAFPRGAANDPQWADVALLAGYDTAIQDESGFARALFANSGAAQFTVSDGAAVGSFSTVNKATPDDNTFLSASLVAATGVLTMTTQPANGDTVTVGTKDGTNAAVYTFKTAIAAAYDVLIDTSAQNTLLNLYNAINAGAGAGTKYGTGTNANHDVSATQLPAGQIQATASVSGTSGNSIASTSTGSAAHWGGATLSGGANIPGPSDFKLQRPPVNTTLISAVQLTTRMWKSDAGACTVQPALVGPLGTVENGTAHPLTVSPAYYGDIMETDPDTGASITPATLINGRVRVNRTA